MARKRKKQWSKIIEEAGVRIRLYERPTSSSVWYSIVAEDGRKVRKSLETGDRTLAESRAQAIAQELAKIRYTGGPTTGLTLDRLRALYLHHRGPLLTKVRRRHMKLVLSLVVEHFQDRDGNHDFRIRADGELFFLKLGHRIVLNGTNEEVVNLLVVKDWIPRLQDDACLFVGTHENTPVLKPCPN